MVRRDGFVKVLDFGLAKLAPCARSLRRSHDARVVRTDAGTVVGTMDYMSPEQARGQAVDARTDVWSLGVLLYEMVAGRRPFAGQSSSEVLAGILEHDPAPLARFEPDAPPELQRIVGQGAAQGPGAALSGHEGPAARSASAARRCRGAGQERPQSRTRALEQWRRRQPACACVSGSHAAIAVQRGVRRHRAGQAQDRCGARRVRLGADRSRCMVGGATSIQRHEVVRSTAPVQRTLTRLTFGSGLQTDVTWSPDGRFIAYASDRTGNFDIWVQPVGGGDPVQVTRSAAQDMQPDWSPDGSSLVFRSGRDGGGLSSSRPSVEWSGN